MKILMGTTNPGKIQGARQAFEKYFENVEIEGVKVSSEVSDQPINDEIFQGVRNRVKNVKEKKSQIDDLSNNVLISYGTRGKEVEEVQKKLLDLTNIYSNLPVVTSDGIFSDNTKRAIKKFQQLNALDITGELDKATLKRINEIHECNKEDIEISETRQENGVNYINQSKNQLEMGDKGEYVVYLQNGILISY